jgi:hypothetical protein
MKSSSLPVSLFPKHLILPFFLLTTTLLSIIGCKKDPCENQVCLNGGWCEEGICDCPPGYSGTHCEVYDPCYNQTCYNGGYCSNGDCQCQEGYYGPQCEYQKTPVYMKIEKIVLREFPATDQNGNNWDFYIWPDIYLNIEDNDASVSTTGYYDQCTPGSEYPYVLNNPVYIAYSSKCAVELWDYDGTNGNVYMCGYYFYPANNVNGFPKKITLYNSTAWHQAKLDVYVSWVF